MGSRECSLKQQSFINIQGWLWNTESMNSFFSSVFASESFTSFSVFNKVVDSELLTNVCNEIELFTYSKESERVQLPRARPPTTACLKECARVPGNKLILFRSTERDPKLINNNYSPKWRWLVLDIKCPPLATDTQLNNCFSVLKQWDNWAQKWWFLNHLLSQTIIILERNDRRAVAVDFSCR